MGGDWVNATANKESTTPPWRAGALLALMALIGVGLLAWVHDLTRSTIEAQERAYMLEQLGQVLDPGRFDNDLLNDMILIVDRAAFGHDEVVRIFRARRGGEAVAVIMEVIAPNGYNGNIVMLVGIESTGEITAARVLSHRETPGLGDPIEKRRSDWIDSFQGRSLGDPPPARWAVRKDGGDFDQFTGATITPRAVVTAVARALAYFEDHQEILFQKESMKGPELE